MIDLSKKYIAKFGEGRPDIIRWLEGLTIDVSFTRTIKAACNCCDKVEVDFERFNTIAEFADWYDCYEHQNLCIEIKEN